jgi:hypothetical protein
MLSLEHSEDFKKDFMKFKTEIDNLDDLFLKEKLTNLLNSLLESVRKIDELHKESIFDKAPLSSKVIRETIIKIRSELVEQLLMAQSRYN